MTRGWNLLALGLALAAAGCGEAASEKVAEVRPVRTLVVDPKPIDDDAQAIGEIKPRYESDLGFRVAGKIIATDWSTSASLVKKGDVLARLDDQDYRNKAASRPRADIVAAAGRAGRGAGRRGAAAPAAGQRQHDHARQL